MAGSTLSFFSRLFSSKKKKILEKRELESHQGNSNESEETTSRYTDRKLDPEKNHDSKKDTNSYRESTNVDNIEDKETSDSLHDKLSDNLLSQNAVGVVSQGYTSDTPPGASISISNELNDSGVMSITAENTNEESNASQGYPNSFEESASDTDQDDSLEYDSMVLLSKLEQLTIKLSDKTVQKSAPLVIEALVDMANYVVEFSEQLPISETKKIPLKMLLNRDEQNYKTLKIEYIQNERLVIEPTTVSESFQGQESFTNISNDLLRVINVYLSASVKAYKSSRISEQWKTLYTGFFVNLTKSVRSSQANQHI